jgi:signal transduction histidine kinase
MIRKLWQKFGPVKTCCLVTVVSIISSEFIYFILSNLLGVYWPLGYFMAGIIPLVVATPISFLFLRIGVQLYNTEESLKQAYQELKNLQAQLVQSGKLASLGELAAGIAHELNQPLMVIRANSQIIRKQFDTGELEGSSQRDIMDTIERNTKRMMNIINHLRSFSRQSKVTFSPFSLNRVIENCFLIIGEQLRIRDIQVRTVLESALPEIQGDANQIEQVFLNLISNARDSIGNRILSEKGREGSKKRRIGLIEIQTRVSINDAGWIEALVIDNGSGVDAEIKEKIFDPFFTTKDVGMGTGLGLSISYGIIHNHGGEIQLAHSDSEGTTMQVRLPILERHANDTLPDRSNLVESDGPRIPKPLNAII